MLTEDILTEVSRGSSRRMEDKQALWQKNQKEEGNKKAVYVLAAAGALVILLINGLALKERKVFFLYEDERKNMEFVRENKKEPVVVFYNDASADNIWWLSDELMEYERFYLASQGNKEKITDEAIIKSDRLLVYVADYEDKEACLRGLLEVNDKLTGYEVAAKKGLWTLYEMY